uniref:Armadillo repeat containing 7 n=1 Tax=Serinus canaria TaxID=9135 RepID=A0A8C9KUT4_SERCA
MELGRLEYLQALVTEFQVTDSTEAKEQVLANLANFAYDPSNYEYLRQLQVLDLFLDMLTEDNETLVEFAMGKDCPERPQLSPGQGTAGLALRLVANPP